jgi:ferredoxin--NADP+ reductase
MFDIPCGLVIPAVGYRSIPMAGAPFDDRACIIPNEDGRVAAGLYAVGWIKRGPSGVIASNRPDGVVAAEHILQDIVSGSKPGRALLEKHLVGGNVRMTDITDWQTIRTAEEAAAKAPAPRAKLATIAEMLAVLDRA